MKIKNVHAREILNSRGLPTISTEIEVWSGEKGVSEVPSGASTGKTEVIEIRDGDKDRYNGKGVQKAVEFVNGKIKDLLVDKEFTSQKEFDQLLIAVSNVFGLELYEYLGMTYWEKKYDEMNFKVPTPQILMMEGAKHGNWATDIQEYMIVPNMDTFKTFSEALRVSTEIFHTLHDILDEKSYSVGLGLEGAYAPQELKSNEEAFEIIMEAIKKSGFKPGDDFKLALDLAASEFYDEDNDKYILKSEGKELIKN